MKLIFLSISFSLMLASIAFSADEQSCSFGVNPGNPILDVHGLTDTVHALAIWTCSDSATWISTFPDCDEFYPPSYDMPDFADALWDSSEFMSASKFYLDNSNRKHYLTAETPRSPQGGMWIVNGDVYNDYWDEAYIERALTMIDDDLDFSQYDHNQDGTVDQVFFYTYHIDGRGTIGNVNFPTDDSVQTQNGRVRVYVNHLVTIRCTQGDYWSALGFTVHEYGHTFSVWDLYSNGLTNGLGGFCCQAGNGFWNQAHTEKRPALHNPAVRTGAYWITQQSGTWVTPTVIATSQLDFQLSRYDEDAAIYRINPDATRPSQYFLLDNHLRTSRWERDYPGKGLLIWHIDTTSSISVARGGRKRFDIEDASGMWGGWTFQSRNDTVYSPIHCFNPTGFSVTARNTGTNSGQPNPVSGIDSMDVAYVTGNGEYTAPTYLNNEAGAASTLFLEGKIFGPATNPNTNLYAGEAQSVRTGVDIQVVEFDTVNNKTIAHIIVDGKWQGATSHNVTWMDSAYVSGNLSLNSPATLTILPGTVINMANNALLTVNGKLSAIGTATEPITFLFPSNTGTGGLFFINADSVEMQYCIFDKSPEVYFQDCDFAHVQYCTFDSCNLGLYLYDNGDSNLVVENNYFVHCKYGIMGTLGAGTFTDNTIEYSTRAGIYWYGDKASTGERAFFNSNEVRYGVNTVLALTGGYFNSTTAMLECNRFEFNRRYQIRCESQGNIVMNGNYAVTAANILADSSSQIWCAACDTCSPNPCPGAGPTFRPLLYIKSAVPALNYGANTFRFINDGVFAYDASANCTQVGPHYFKENYYEANGVLASPPGAGNDHFCPWYAFQDILPLSSGVECAEGGMMAMSGSEGAYQQAVASEQENNFSLAAEQYEEIIADYPTDPEAVWSARGYLRTGLESSTPMQRHDELSSIWQDESRSTSIRQAARREAVWALIAGQRYDDARTELSAIEFDPNAGEDSIWAVITTEAVSLLDIGAGTNSVGAQAAGMSHRIKDFHNRLHQIMGRPDDTEYAQETVDQQPIVPVKFSLAQNYPNPFNPTTEISYTLPAIAKTSLRIFDITGRQVAELVNKTQAAGQYTVPFDGSGKPSGIYFYRLQAGEYSGTRKMVLLK